MTRVFKRGNVPDMGACQRMSPSGKHSNCQIAFDPQPLLSFLLWLRGFRVSEVIVVDKFILDQHQKIFWRSSPFKPAFVIVLRVSSSQRVQSLSPLLCMSETYVLFLPKGNVCYG